LYKEINESFRQSFAESLKTIPAESLVYIDETGLDQYLHREYAYAPRGQKVIEKISGKKYKRTNIVAGICGRKWVAPMEYNGTTDSRLFEFWFEYCLLKEVKPGSVIVLDNATFHKKSVIPVLAMKKNCSVLFLPPYSPDLNPIEQKWAWLKKRLRKILPDFDSFESALACCF
jgi:transposase